MRKVTLFLSLTLLSVILFGCQSEDNPTEQTETNKSEITTEDKYYLYLKDDISKIVISKSKEVNPTVYEEDKDIETIKSVILSAVKRDGIANMADPEYDLDVIYTNEDKQSFHLWLGEKGLDSALGKTEDTHTIYRIREEIADKLRELLE